MTLPEIQPLLDWLAGHPGTAQAFIFLVALLESLALVGLLMPGAVVMFAAGAAIGAGALPFVPLCLWAAAGAVAGDGISYWIGRRFHGRLDSLRPFRNRPQLIGRATDFFHRHGGKSILFGRFVGPMRPVLPAIAGMLRMPAGRFFAVNILSGLLWAPAYLLPGVAVGASLGLAAEVATRLALALALLLLALLLLGWAIRALFRLLHPHAHTVITRVLAWTRLHPIAGQIPAALLDPAHREAKGLTLLALTLIVAAGSFVVLLDAVEAGGRITAVDRYLFHALQALRTPWMDRIMVAVTSLGDWQILLPLFAAILLWLAWQRRWMAAAHWCGAAGFALALTQALKITTGVVRPTALYDGLSAFSFPSGHATLATVVYGFLAVLVARELPLPRRWIAYALTGPLIAAIAFSRLYLGAHWLSDVLGGLTLGTAWVALLGIAYRRHPAATLPLRGLLLASAAALLLAGVVHIPFALQSADLRYAPEAGEAVMGGERWWNDGWRALPAFRSDLQARRRQPFTVQYAGGLAALTEDLRRRGWRGSIPLDGASWLRWFSAGTPIGELPVLPQVHDGRHETLLLIKPLNEGEMLALRLWPSGLRLQPGGVPLWIGSVTRLGLYAPAPGFGVPRTLDDFDAARRALAADLEAGAVVSRLGEREGYPGGVVLLLNDRGAAISIPPSPAAGAAAPAGPPVAGEAVFSPARAAAVR